MHMQKKVYQDKREREIQSSVSTRLYSILLYYVPRLVYIHSPYYQAKQKQLHYFHKEPPTEMFS